MFVVLVKSVQCTHAMLIECVSQKEKEDLEDVSNELELADEEDKIPYAILCPGTFYMFETDVLQIQNRRFIHLPTCA